VHVDDLVGQRVDDDGYLCCQEFLRACDVDDVFLVYARRGGEDFATREAELGGVFHCGEHFEVGEGVGEGDGVVGRDWLVGDFGAWWWEGYCGEGEEGAEEGG